ncbi:MAG TPA: hypothetical protein VF123_18295 [Candidatus Sulfotelmatobacter sp.]
MVNPTYCLSFEEPLQKQQKMARPWRLVAAEAVKEQDPQNLVTLLEELNHALGRQGMVNPDAQSRLRTSE